LGRNNRFRWNYRVIISGGIDWNFNGSLHNNRKKGSPSGVCQLESVGV